MCDAFVVKPSQRRLPPSCSRAFNRQVLPWLVFFLIVSLFLFVYHFSEQARRHNPRSVHATYRTLRHQRMQSHSVFCRVVAGLPFRLSVFGQRRKTRSQGQ